MANKKFIQIPEAPELSSEAYFVGNQDNGGGNGTDYRYTQAQVVAMIATATRKVITVDTTADTLTDTFFETNEILTLETNGQTYIVNVNFTQSGDTITGTGGLSFYEGQVVIARI